MAADFSMIDLNKETVEITFDVSQRKLWVNVNGVCALRAQNSIVTLAVLNEVGEFRVSTEG